LPKAEIETEKLPENYAPPSPPLASRTLYIKIYL